MPDALSALVHRTSFTWWDAIDILLVAILIYEALKLIRGTRAVQMAASSGILVLLFVASTTMPLQTVNWLIRNMVGYVVFAAIVLFQSDIRRGMAHFGRAPFFRVLTRPETGNETIEEVVVAASTLAGRRQGAIIVIEREIGLRNYIESGIPLDAQVTYDLLVSIFQPTAPLHDGAVIIQEGRIAAASCFLPLTVQPALSRELGTRHRAAIGLTEENDAVAVIVSEESGLISIALDGTIERGLGPADLRARLKDLVVQRRATAAPAAGARLTSPMAYHPFRHLGLKILSIALAGAIWLTVGDQRAVERTMRVPLEYHNLPANLELMASPPDTVEVRLRGPSGTIGRLLPGEVVAVLDLTAARPGTRLFHMLVGRSAGAVRRRCLPGEPGGAAADVRAGLEARRAGRPGRRRRAGAGLSHRTDPVVARAGDGGRAHQPRRRRRQRDDRAGVGGQRHRQRDRSRRRRRRQRTGAARPAAERHGLGGDRPGRGGQAARSRARGGPRARRRAAPRRIEPASVVVVLRGPARRAGADHDGDGLRRRHRHGAGPPLHACRSRSIRLPTCRWRRSTRRRSPCA